MDVISRFSIFDDDPRLLRRFTAYIELIISHARIDYLRKQSHRTVELSLDEIKSDEEPAYEDPFPKNHNEFDFEEERLSTAFSDLSLLRRRILTFIFVDGLSAQETANKLNCSVDYVYLQKHRILNALRDQLMEGGYTHGE